MDLRYSSTMSGMKEDIILQSYQGVNTFSFGVETAGLKLKQSGGQYVIADDEVIFSFCELFINDGVTVKAAVEYAADVSGLTSAVICGSENLILQDIDLS